MQLQPKRPPGRADRKAAVYASEILRLRAEGYTYEAIREALAEVGVRLSESALRREVRRSQRALPPAAVVDARSTLPNMQPRPVAQPTGQPSSPGKSGRDIAEAFFDTHLSNPLFAAKDTP